MCVGVPPPQVRQQKREVELALKLAELCSSYIGALADGTLDAWTSKMRAEAKDLASVSFGDCLLFVVAELYPCRAQVLPVLETKKKSCCSA